MKKTVCDKCGSDHGRSFKYKKQNRWAYTDLCINCMQNFVLENQIKLVEATDGGVGPDQKKVIHG